jgi:hypothetical protein
VIFYRPQSIADIKKFISVDSYQTIKVPNSKLVWADYDALKRDFPFLQNAKKEKIDSWILNSFSYISTTQLELGELRNTLIPTEETYKQSFRQANHSSEHQEFQGRGDMMEVHDFEGNLAGLIDRKGVGISKKKLEENLLLKEKFQRSGNPKGIETKNLSNGLSYLGEAVIEAAAMKVTQRAFDWLNEKKDFDLPFPNIDPFVQAPLQTIEGYFVIQMPFQLKAGESGSFPAAIYGRQAHVGRVWTGKIFTQKINIKQSDFFFSSCDGGTVRIRIPELSNTVDKIKGGPNLLHYQMGLDIVSRVVGGEENVLQKVIDEVLAPFGALPKAKSFSFFKAHDAFGSLVEILLSDPIRFQRFNEVLWYVAKQNPKLFLEYREKIAIICRRYLALEASVLDIDESFRPLRRMGLLLISALPEEERSRVWQTEIKKWFQEPEILAKSAVLLPFAEVEKDLTKLFRLAGGWLKNEIHFLLLDADKIGDPRRKDWLLFQDWLNKKHKAWCPKAIPFNQQHQVRLAYLVSFARSFAFIN